MLLVVMKYNKKREKSPIAVCNEACFDSVKFSMNTKNYSAP